MTTIYDVAREANVSPSTVSRVINNSAVVSGTTKKRVFDAINKLGYEISSGTDSVNGKIILVVSDVMMSEYNTSLYKEISENGYQMLPFFLCEGVGTHTDLLHFLQAMIPLQKIAGIILDNFDHSENDLLIQTIQQCPTVLINSYCPIEPHISVGIDYFQSAYVATKHLLASGCRRIAIFFSGEGDQPAHTQMMEHSRISGYRTALSEYGITFDDSLLLETDMIVEGAIATTKEVISDSSTVPDAFVCPFDVIALGCMRAITQEGLRIPEDIMLVSLMNDWYSPFLNPSISSIQYPYAHVAHEAVRLLCNQIKGDRVMSQDVRIPFAFIHRESSGRLI